MPPLLVPCLLHLPTADAVAALPARLQSGAPASPRSPFAADAAGTPGLAESLLMRMERSIAATEGSIDQLKARPFGSCFVQRLA